MFRRIIFSASLSGLIAGLVITAIQSFTVIPMILYAETFEVSQPEASIYVAPGTANDMTGHHHEHDNLDDNQEPGAAHMKKDGHVHNADEWGPQDGIERAFYTVLTNVLAAIGFALLLAACFTFFDKVDWRIGMLWGVGGFVAFQLAPSFGLPPELPGTEAAALEARQIWWVATAIATAVGLLLLANARQLLLKVSGILFVVIPHLVGAPQPVEHSALAPDDLISQFIVVTTVTGAIFWIMLGGLTAYTHGKMS